MQYRSHGTQPEEAGAVDTAPSSFEGHARAEILKGLMQGGVTVIWRDRKSRAIKRAHVLGKTTLGVADLGGSKETIPLTTESRPRGQKETCWLDKVGTGLEPGREAEPASGAREPGRVSEQSAEPAGGEESDSPGCDTRQCWGRGQAGVKGRFCLGTKTKTKQKPKNQQHPNHFSFP